MNRARNVRPHVAASSAALVALILSGCHAGPGQAPDEGAGAPVGQAQQASSSVTDNLNVIEGAAPGCTAVSGFDSTGASGVVDTQLDQGNPSTPASATITSMETGPDAGGNLQYSLVQFSLAALPSGSALAALHASSVHVNDAYMFLTLSSDATSTGTVNVHQVTSPWDPTATWNSAPTWISTPASSFEVASGTLADDELSAINMFSLVSEWASGAPNYGVLLEEGVPPTSTGPAASFLRSDDSDLWFRPQLTVIYTLRCSAGYADCDGDSCNGCEASITSRPEQLRRVRRGVRPGQRRPAVLGRRLRHRLVRRRLLRLRRQPGQRLRGHLVRERPAVHDQRGLPERPLHRRRLRRPRGLRGRDE